MGNKAPALEPAPAPDVNEPPNHILCPITMDVISDPVVAEDGHTYERRAIKTWFKQGNQTSPITRAPLDSTKLIPNWTRLTSNEAMVDHKVRVYKSTEFCNQCI